MTVTHHVLYQTWGSLDVCACFSLIFYCQTAGLKVCVHCCPLVQVMLVHNCFCWIIRLRLKACLSKQMGYQHEDTTQSAACLCTCVSCVCSLDSLEGGWQVSEKSPLKRLWVVTGPLQSQFPPWTFTCTGPEPVSLPLLSFGERIWKRAYMFMGRNMQLLCK